jgi:hypothetical protein
MVRIFSTQIFDHMTSLFASKSRYPLRGHSLPPISANKDKSHVHDPKKEVLPSFYGIFVALQCFVKHPWSLQVGTPHFIHPNLVLCLFWASVLLQLPEISPKTCLFCFLIRGSVQIEQYRCGSPDPSSWCCISGSGIGPSAGKRFGCIRTLLLSKAFCKSTQNRCTSL